MPTWPTSNRFGKAGSLHSRLSRSPKLYAERSSESTPKAQRGSLEVLRERVVIEWCREEGLTVRAEPLEMSILTQADEVFITSTVKDVMAVHAIDDRLLAAPGPVTAQVVEIFTRLSRERLDP